MELSAKAWIDIILINLGLINMNNSALPEKNLFDRVTDYYRGERISNALLFVLGSGSIIWTYLLNLWRQGMLSSGLFISSIPLGLFLIITGGYRFIRSLKRYKEAHDELIGEKYLSEIELPHLENRKKRFKGKRKVNTIGFMIGMIMIALCILFEWNHILLGTAISLTLFSSILLVFDLFSQFRTEEFLHHLYKWKRKG